VRQRSSLVTIGRVAAALALPVLCWGRSAEGWRGEENSHFAIFTAGQENRESEILGRLEVARVFFEKSGLANPTGTPQLNILAMGSNKDNDVYRLNPAAFAFYQRTREGDFVVMHDLAPEHIPVAVHEYTHFVVEHAGLKLPIWLSEGLADFYSTVQGRNAQVVLGGKPSGREDTLSRSRWIDWNSLVAVDHDSPYYRQADKMLLFYAQSWAMVHMLALDADYQAGFGKFLQTVSGGATTETAMMAVYHKSLEQIGQDVREYIGSKRMTVRLVNIDVRTASLETEQIGDAGKRVEFALAEIMATSPQLASDANGRLAALATKYGDDPKAEETLGFQAMQAGRQKDAQEHFARAVQRHSQNPEVWFRLAHLKLQTDGPTEEVVDLLERVIAADGNHYGARLELGFAAAKKEKYEIAVRALEGISEVKPEHAYVVSYTLAYCLVATHKGNQARMYAEQARKIAGSNRDRDEVAGLMRYIEQEAPVEVASR
jgi:tetratricopeptide (TPR) repeat protein